MGRGGVDGMLRREGGLALREVHVSLRIAIFRNAMQFPISYAQRDF